MNNRRWILVGFLGGLLVVTGCFQATNTNTNTNDRTDTENGEDSPTDIISEESNSNDGPSMADDGVASDTGETVDEGGDTTVEDDNEGEMVQKTVQTFEIAARNFSYSLSEIRVKRGDVVKINLRSVDGFHDWVVDQFDAKTLRINTGGSASVQFTADKAGTFEYYCSVGNHKAMGMVGKLIVE